MMGDRFDEEYTTPHGDCIEEIDNLKAALADLHRQVSKFCEENGEAEFYTGNALAALRLSDNPVHLRTLHELRFPANPGVEHGK